MKRLLLIALFVASVGYGQTPTPTPWEPCAALTPSYTDDIESSTPLWIVGGDVGADWAITTDQAQSVTHSLEATVVTAGQIAKARFAIHAVPGNHYEVKVALRESGASASTSTVYAVVTDGASPCGLPTGAETPDGTFIAATDFNNGVWSTVTINADYTATNAYLCVLIWIDNDANNTVTYIDDLEINSLANATCTPVPPTSTPTKTPTRTPTRTPTVTPTPTKTPTVPLDYGTIPTLFNPPTSAISKQSMMDRRGNRVNMRRQRD